MSDFDELKNLLFGAEKQVLDSITERVQRPETRAADVADILPEAIRLSHRQGDQLVSTLRDPVGQCLKESLRDAPEEYADALYPVMGPAIRKSIVHTLRAFTQQINQTVEHSLSAKGLKWRFAAWRSGVPFGDYVIQQTLLYRIEQAYLISRENGLLVSHVHHEASSIKDSEAVSAMFTAIQDFVKESFSPDRSGRLETADMGDFTVWAVHGPHALLVCVIRGVPPAALRGELSSILERIQFRYGDSIRHYVGDTSTVQGVEEELQECLAFEAQQAKDSEKRGQSAALIIALLAIAAAIIYFGVNNWMAERQYQKLATTINSTPGVFLAELKRDGKVFTVRGLRDPLALSLENIAATAGLESSQIISELQPYQSLESEITLLRAQALLNIPATVSASTGEQLITLSGTASQEWIDSTKRKAEAGLQDWSVDLAAVESSDLTHLQADVAKAAIVEFPFVSNASFSDTETASLQQHAATVRELAGQAEQLDATLRINVIGYTDATGSITANTQLASLRASVAATALIEQGIDPGLIVQSREIPTDQTGVPNPELRKVAIKLSLQLPVQPGNRDSQ